MAPYVVAGLALGSIYAIAAAGLVITFISAGVLNFAFASMAYVVARFYYWLNSQHNWTTWSAGLVSLLLFAPLLGMVLYVVLFRFLRDRSSLVKIVATIGLSVALPPIADLTFGPETITLAPGLGLSTDQPIHIFGLPVTTDELITFGFVVFVVVAGSLILRFTTVGLKVRAMVDSEAMTSLSGTNPNRVAVAVWAVSAGLAGVAGVLVAPSNGLTTAGMTALMAAAFAAVVAARFTSLVVAVSVALLMGVVTDVIQKYLPPTSSLTAAVIPSIPFVVIVVFLVYYVLRSGSFAREVSVDGPLDRAIRSARNDAGGPETASMGRGVLGKALSILPMLAVLCVPLVFRNSPYWLGLVALGLCYGVTFLSFTVVTGEGGMLWLSQIIFAGGGALAAAQFAMIWHVPVLLAIVLGGVVMAAVGAVIGILTIRLGDLYVALATLAFGLLAETLVFTMNRFLQAGLGVPFGRPDFAVDDFAFSYFVLAIFVVFALLIVNLRRSTTGLGLRAVRDSETASRTLGISLVRVKVIVGALGAFVAGVGGGLLASYTFVAQPQAFDTFAGLVWLAVVVTMGIRSITAAAIAGLVFSLLPAVFESYVPTRLGEVPAVLFGLGAISIARDPDGVVVTNGRRLRRAIESLASRLWGHGTGNEPAVPPSVRAPAHLKVEP